jgi:hypothetical protein
VRATTDDRYAGATVVVVLVVEAVAAVLDDVGAASRPLSSAHAARQSAAVTISPHRRDPRLAIG